MENKEFAKLWNNVKLSNVEVAVAVGYGEDGFKTAYNKKSKAPLNKLCKVKRTVSFDPSEVTTTGKKTSKTTAAKKPKVKKDSAKVAVTEASVEVETVVAKEAVSIPEFFKVTLCVNHSSGPGGKIVRDIETDTAEEMWEGIQNLKTKYATSSAVVISVANNTVISSAAGLTSGMTVYIKKMPTGSSK